MLIYEWLAYRVVKRGPDCTFFWCGKISAFTMRLYCRKWPSSLHFSAINPVFLISVGTEVFLPRFLLDPVKMKRFTMLSKSHYAIIGLTFGPVKFEILT